MKLTLQQMEKSVINKSLDQERTRKSIETMLAQVEVLNGIAGSFSSFATMPAPVLKKVDVTLLLDRTVALFEKQEKAVIKLDRAITPIFALGDEQLLGRIFSNIILNALQSAENGDNLLIEIKN